MYRASGPGPQIIERKSDEVDVVRTNDWQLLLCQITQGCADAALSLLVE
jgi:hypothetical protein